MVARCKPHWFGNHMCSCLVYTTANTKEIYRVILVPMQYTCEPRKDVLHMDCWINVEDTQGVPKNFREFCKLGPGPIGSLEVLDLYLNKWEVGWKKDNTRKKLILLVPDYRTMRLVTLWLGEYEDDYVELMHNFESITLFINDHEDSHNRRKPFWNHTLGSVFSVYQMLKTYQDPVQKAVKMATVYNKLLHFSG